MIIKNKKESGVILLEMILAGFLLGLLLLGVMDIIQRQEKFIKSRLNCSGLHSFLEPESRAAEYLRAVNWEVNGL